MDLEGGSIEKRNIRRTGYRNHHWRVSGNDRIDYPTFHLSMDCFWCEVIKGDLVLKEHQAARWLDQNSLNEVEWLPADIALIDRLQNRDGLR